MPHWASACACAGRKLPTDKAVMSSPAAAHVRHLRRLALTRDVQQMALTFVKYGSAAYFFRTYVMGVTAVGLSNVLQ